MTAAPTHDDKLCPEEWHDTSGRATWTRVVQALERSKSSLRKLRPGEDILTFGTPCDAIHLLVSGWAYVFRPLEDGQQVILQFADRGTIIGFHPEPNATAQYSARTLSNSTIAVVSYDHFELLFKEAPDVAIRLAALLSRDRNLAFDSVTSFSRISARQRVARLLLQLTLHASAQGAYPKELSIPLTQEHIADATGLSTGHVNRTLGELRRNGIVEFQYRKLRILNLGDLITAAGIDGPSAKTLRDVAAQAASRPHWGVSP